MGLYRGKVDLEAAFGILEGCIEQESTGNVIGSVQGETDFSCTSRKRKLATKLCSERVSKDVLVHRDFFGFDCTNFDADREFGKGKRRRLGGERVGLADGASFEFDGLGGQAIDLEPPLEKRTPVPIEGHGFEAKPNALGICDGDFFDAGHAAECAGETVDRHRSSGARERVLEKAGEASFVLFAVCEDGEGKTEEEKAQKAFHQKACPIPT